MPYWAYLTKTRNILHPLSCLPPPIGPSKTTNFYWRRVHYSQPISFKHHKELSPPTLLSFHSVINITNQFTKKVHFRNLFHITFWAGGQGCISTTPAHSWSRLKLSLWSTIVHVDPFNTSTVPLCSLSWNVFPPMTHNLPSAETTAGASRCTLRGGSSVQDPVFRSSDSTTLDRARTPCSLPLAIG